MRFSLKYSFKKVCFGINKEEILKTFVSNFDSTDCQHQIIISDNKLDLYNDPFDFNYLFKLIIPGNIWYGIGNMRITVLPCALEKSNIIQFSISIYRQLIIFIITNIIGGIIMWSENSLLFLYIFLSLDAIVIISNLISFFLHWRFFNKTIKIGDFNKNLIIKSYNWELILKNKTDSELESIIQGKTHLPDNVIELAKIEKSNRAEIK